MRSGGQEEKGVGEDRVVRVNGRDNGCTAENGSVMSG